jgi:hypothetical protein
MKRTTLTLAVAASMALFTACGGEAPHDHDDDHDHDNDDTTSVEVPEEPASPAAYSAEGIDANGMTLMVYEAEIAAEYPDAHLHMAAPQAGTVGMNSFEFEVTDYELATQTGGVEERNCANSGKGQHIHFILNNQPYKAKYEAAFEEELGEGENVLLAFLSRSYHESIKNGNAHVVTSLYAGEGGSSFDPNGEHLFYSRPKGTYKLAESNRFLLDFFLINVDLEASGYKVRATVDGAVFELPSWKPYFIEGLQAGEHTVRIELIDGSGNAVAGPFNDSGDRAFTVTEG